MALDPALEAALHIAVKASAQPEALANRLIAWLQLLSDGEGSEDQNLHFYENVIGAIKIEDDSNED